MKYKFLKTEKEIIGWLNKYNIKNYTLIPNDKYGFVVDVDGAVNLNNKNLKFIPIKFNIVNSHFWCVNNKLTTLEGCPKNIGGHFWCYSNKIKNYIYFPEKINEIIILNDGKEYTFEKAYKIHLKDKTEYEKQLLNESIKSNNNNNKIYKL